RDLDAVASRLAAELGHRRPIGRGEMHAQQRGLRSLPDGQHVMLAAGRAELDGVAFERHFFQRPELAVELRRLLEIANAEIDAAHAGDPGIWHGKTSRDPVVTHRAASPSNFAQSAAKS